LKILCISDQIDPLVYSVSIKERFANIDMVLAAGDLPMDYLDFVMSMLNKPLFFVFGNHHIEEMKYFFDNSLLWGEEALEQHSWGGTHVGSNIKMDQGLIVVGLGGSMRYNRGDNQYTEFQMYLEIMKLLPRLLYHRVFHGRFLDILLTHAPPKDIHDKKDKCHQGFKAFRWFMKVFEPKYLVHGHIHLYDLSAVRVTQWERTTVVNAYSHYIIDFDKGK
jgi:Icc-related predicted phosphoesterase